MSNQESFKVHTRKCILEEMKKASAKELRQKAAALLGDVRNGQEYLITHRGKPVAILSPVEKVGRRSFEPIGFGIWKNRSEFRNVDKWLNRVRRPRFKK